MNYEKFTKKIELGNMILSEDFAKLSNEVIALEKAELKANLLKSQQIKRNSKHGVILQTQTPLCMILVKRIRN